MAVSSIPHVYFFTFLFSIIHELIHLIFIYAFKSRVSYFSLSVFGAEIKRLETFHLSFLKEAIISFSAPVFNIILGLSFLRNNKTVATTNLIIGLFNLLPFYTFDGGRGVFYLLKYATTEKKAEIIITITSVAITIIFSFVGVFVFFNYNRNYTLLVFTLYLFLTLIFKNKRIFIKDKL